MERVNDDMQTIRDVAEQVGISFPDAENAPPCSGVHVPRNGRDIRDSLQYAGYQGIFPVPDLSMFTEVPAEQHDLLNLDIQNEDLLNKFRVCSSMD